MSLSTALVGSTQEEILNAAAILRQGGLVAFPTETVYGLGADAASDSAVARIFSVKGRPVDHPLIVHLASVDEIERWARDIPASVWRLAERFWPGPLTLILQRAPQVLDSVTGGQDTVGLRVPDHPVARDLLRAFGGGIAAPSANRFGRVSTTSAAHVIAEFGDAVDCVIEGGSCEVGLESTILDLSGERPAVLRPGAVMPGELAAILGEPAVERSGAVPRVPGCLPSHYAPDTPLQLLETAAIAESIRSFSDAGQSVAVLSLHAPVICKDHCRWMSMPTDPRQYAQRLYASLREVDAWGCHCILVELPPADIEWEAVRDRLRRAADSDSQPDIENPCI